MRTKSSTKPPKGNQNPHLQARLAYLYKAATYLSTHQPSQSSQPSVSSPALPRHLASQLRAVSLKSQLRLAQPIKRSLCNRCNTLLQDGSASVHMENESRSGVKPWADVLVIQCAMCEAVKRFPVGSKRQGKKGARESAKMEPVESTGDKAKVRGSELRMDRNRTT
ncbi:Rpr2-domain-containing protein [Eremomyces bilateralis CBS 781.70]|uniref:Rpr2-domain-containing protein n=1 Tax=Eremomyces bilateralis CBS 781.70 TaxID=1392243 RepID=A0A6G1FTP0_9PEZI|nr:Rpr2-domain-containing protein [Eremomyces bilateralis CBS 781.70]KAF1809123.1 Rpr2-domain-containing protein [Eremomyces bilateralis CBS 781.70]